MSNGAINSNSGMGTGNMGSNINNQQQIIINDINDQYDQNCILDVTVNTCLMIGGPEKYSYSPGFGGWDYEQVDLSDEFKQHYELWLQQEVYNMNINWDSLKLKFENDDAATNE